MATETGTAPAAETATATKLKLDPPEPEQLLMGRLAGLAAKIDRPGQWRQREHCQRAFVEETLLAVREPGEDQY